jgi:hypothetical protein
MTISIWRGSKRGILWSRDSSIVEGFLNSPAFAPHPRKQELKDRFMAAVDYFSRDPLVHTWTYKLGKAAGYDSNCHFARENPPLPTPFSIASFTTPR